MDIIPSNLKCMQDVSARIVDEKRDELREQISPKAEVVARNQEAKRHELDNRMRAIALDHKAAVTGKVWRTVLFLRVTSRTTHSRSEDVRTGRDSTCNCI